ncbi:hypothetical protein [Mesorhizobium sp. M0030]|uniref:hypothetical protein n=1 Tax=Mesorhizobium sp. M0030 TaxID=2956851 RepID=UPI00333AA0BF
MMGIEFGSDGPSSNAVPIIMMLVVGGVILSAVFKEIGVALQRLGLSKDQKRVLDRIAVETRPRAGDLDFDIVRKLVELGLIETNWGEALDEWSIMVLTPKGEAATGIPGKRW